VQTKAEFTKLPRVTVRFFTALRAIAGEDEAEIQARDVREALTVLANKYGAEFKESLFDPEGKIDLRFYRIFVNKQVLTPQDGLEKSLHDGDLLQIFPPVVGG
jgi:MoaD family protein